MTFEEWYYDKFEFRDDPQLTTEAAARAAWEAGHKSCDEAHKKTWDDAFYKIQPNPTKKPHWCHAYGEDGCSESHHVGGNYGSPQCRNPNHHKKKKR